MTAASIDQLKAVEAQILVQVIENIFPISLKDLSQDSGPKYTGFVEYDIDESKAEKD